MKIKKPTEKIIRILLYVLFSPILFIIFFILTIIKTPKEKIQYKKSYFYKELKIKYYLGITQKADYNIYNCMRENFLQIKVISDDNYLYYKVSKSDENIILLTPWFESIFFDNNIGKWMIQYKDLIEFEQSLKVVITKLNIIDSKHVKVLFDVKQLKKEQLHLAKQNEQFIIYSTLNELRNKLNKLLKDNVKHNILGAIQYDDYFWFKDYSLNLFGKLELGKLLFDGEENQEIDPMQIQALKIFEDNLSEILMESRVKLFEYYNDVVQEYREAYDEDADEFAPLINNMDELKSLLVFDMIFIPSVIDQDQLVIGIMLNSKWEEEHGIAVKVINGEVIEVGYQDIIR